MKLLRTSGWVAFLGAVITGLTVVDLGPPTDPAVATVGVLRVLSLGVAWYLLVATAVAVVAGARRVRLVPGLVRWMVVGASLVPAATAGTAVAAAVPSSPPVMQPVDEPAPAPVEAPGRAPANPAPARTWTVEPGDHLWRVAERTLADAWGRPATDDEVVPYWRQVVDANRPTLADPANPDLVFAGQQLTIPEPPAAPYVGRP